MSIMMFLNLKGGVAKTTNAVAVAECLADSGHRVLVIDADHQCMSGELLLGDKKLMECERRKITLHDMLAAMLEEEFQQNQIAAYIVRNGSNIGGGIENLSVLPCSVRIDDFSTNMAKARRGYKSTQEFLSILKKRRNLLRRFLTTHFDFTIIDCPPSVAIQVQHFLTISDAYILPCVPDRLSIRGSLWLLDRLRRAGIKKIRPLGTLWSLYRKQNAMHKKMIQATTNGRGQLSRLPTPFRTIIPNASAIAASTEPSIKPASFSDKYTGNFAKLFRSLCDEIVQRSQWAEEKSPKTENVTAS